MRILIVEPFFTGSHQQWAEEYAKHSKHEVKILSLDGRYWKWRMHGGAVALAKSYLEMNWDAELILASDMLDVAVFLSLIRHKSPQVRTALYFHENQLNYPWSPTDQDTQLKRDNHYAFINFTSALAADQVLFNSDYHREAFLEELPKFLKQFPDYPELWTVEQVKEKSQTLYLGLDLKKFDQHRLNKSNKKPLLLWNHRWEYDKNPEIFFQTLMALSDEGLDFELAVLGEHYRKYPSIFKQAKEHLAKHIVHWGYADSFSDYAQWLWKADVSPVTSVHDFFGASVVQAIYCGCIPLLPNRLAYPEHLPLAVQSSLLYDDYEGFKQKLEDIIKHGSTINSDNLQQHVSRYDWLEMVKRYDEQLAL